MASSYQLPDLLILSRPFELRTNRSCRMVTMASEAWLLALKNPDLEYVLTGPEQSSLPASKMGLLAALCFPSCDGTPLRLLTDFLSFHVLADERIRSVSDVSELGWRVANRKSGLDRLGDHELFQYLVPRIVQLSSKAPPTWDVQFTRSVNSYYDAQFQLMNNRCNSVIPHLEEYIELRRGLSGFGMALNLLELTENMTFPSMDIYRGEKMEHLKRLAIDIISCSLDVVSFNRDQAQGNRHNLITVLMTQNGLSVQGALNSAGIYIQDLFDSFVASESVLMGARGPTPPHPNHPRSMSLYFQAWNWFPFSHISAASSPLMESETSKQERDDTSLGDIPSYVQALRDCVVGTINWAYETELYFGKKGEEIRTFGWVFSNQHLEAHGEEPS